MFRFLVVAFFLGWVALPVAPATAEPSSPMLPDLPCSGYDQIRRELDEQYAEEPVSLGLQSNGNLLQVFASSESGTWTIVSMSPNGTACVVAAGASWENLVQPAADPLLGDGA